MIAAAFAAQGWVKPQAQYESYLADQEAGRRVVLIREVNGLFAGYLTVVWESWYESFRQRGIPEVSDFNVLVAFQRQGLGSGLMDEAERLIASRSSEAGIGVGLTVDYGAAQRLYVRRGYVPDGAGLFHNDKNLRRGDTAVVDDDLVLYLTKRL